jgi:hypothetical protein
VLLPAAVEKIHYVQSGWTPELRLLKQKITELERVSIAGRSDCVVKLLCAAVPTFRPLNHESARPATERLEKNGTQQRWAVAGQTA